MKALTRILMLVVVATLVSGFVDMKPRIVTEPKTLVETVAPNETFWELAEHNYNYDNERISFDEFMYNVRHHEANKKTFFNPDGSPRMLQAGDKIVFVVKARVQKDGE